MEGIREFLTRPVGPLPIWGWLAIAIVGLYLWKKHEANAASGTTSSGLTSLLGGSSTSTPVGSTVGADGSAAADASSASGADNASWANDAIGYLEGQGYTAAQAQSAISTYVAGGTLDPSMATLVDSASQGVGQPPQLILPTSSIPQLPTPSAGAGVTSSTGGGASTVTTSQSTPTYVSAHQAAYGAAGATPAAGGPKDSSGHQSYFKYTVRKGDTAASIASKFGSGTKQLDTWNNLKGNPKVGSSIWV